ncbi:type 1 fimbrial protein [Achromobacter xylosoxidans]|uniref:type 1 fimbrial protein n=1 Tax=Alcaligenes xylosoxydans xylosoxydans TaxID=85698 RepID=UPI000B48B0D5|nr:type 1 fimbrial protein [Achromobacter xylosoxidans]
MSKLHYRLSLLLLGVSSSILPAAHAADGTIYFQGAIVEAASCTPQVQSRKAVVRLECDAERARAAGIPADRYRLSASRVQVDVQPVSLKARQAGQKDAQGYIVTLAYL